MSVCGFTVRQRSSKHRRHPVPSLPHRKRLSGQSLFRLQLTRPRISPCIEYDQARMAHDDVPPAIATGLYDEPVTRWLATRLGLLADELKVIDSLDPHYAPEALARLLYRRL